MATATSAEIQTRLSEKELCPDELLRGQEQAFANDIRRLQARKSEFIEVNCPACSSSLATFEFSKHTFDYQSCGSCGTIYMSPRPSPDVMESYYRNSENYQYWARHIFPASEKSRREKLHRPWLQQIIGICERFRIPQRQLVEVGAGFGTFCSVAQQSGQFERVTAIEPTPEMAQACRDRDVEVIEQRIEQIDGDGLAADVAVAFEVIEHLFEPRQLVQQAWKLLRPGGLLVVSCPNGQGFDIATLREQSLAVDPEHVNLFNPHSLSELVESCGFEILEVTTPGRLDAEFVHEAVGRGELDVSSQPLLKRLLVDEWDRLGWPFQQFLAEHGLSSHMWLAARKS